MTSWIGLVLACVVGCRGAQDPAAPPAPTPPTTTSAPPAPSSTLRRDVDALVQDVAQLEARRDALTKEINGAPAIVAASTTEPERQAARDKLATLRTALGELTERATRSTKRAGELRIVEPEAVASDDDALARKDVMETDERLARLARDVAELDTALTHASEALSTAQNDADRAVAKAKLELLRKEKAELEKQKR